MNVIVLGVFVYVRVREKGRKKESKKQKNPKQPHRLQTMYFIMILVLQLER